MNMRRLATLAAAAVFVAYTSPGRTADLLGLYVGGSVGESDVRLDRTFVGTPYPFTEEHAGWKAIVGIRPVHVIGAEIEYLNFGNPSYAALQQSWSANTRAVAAFGTLYAPIPVPFFDLYGKLGLGRLISDVTSRYHGPLPVGVLCYAGPYPGPYCEGKTHGADTGPAYGAGVQFKFGAAALRVEYELIDTSLGDPTMVSLGLTWTF